MYTKDVELDPWNECSVTSCQKGGHHSPTNTLGGTLSCFSRTFLCTLQWVGDSVNTRHAHANVYSPDAELNACHCVQPAHSGRLRHFMLCTAVILCIMLQYWIMCGEIIFAIIFTGQHFWIFLFFIFWFFIFLFKLFFLTNPNRTLKHLEKDICFRVQLVGDVPVSDGTDAGGLCVFAAVRSSAV